MDEDSLVCIPYSARQDCPVASRRKSCGSDSQRSLRKARVGHVVNRSLDASFGLNFESASYNAGCYSVPRVTGFTQTVPKPNAIELRCTQEGEQC